MTLGSSALVPPDSDPTGDPACATIWPRVSWDDRTVEVRRGETALDALLRGGVDMAFSCRGGICHACLVRCRDGEVPEGAQRGLPERLKALNYLLTCQCRPTSALVLERPRQPDLRTPCVLTDVEGQGTAVLTLRFEPMRTLRCRTGQHLRLVTGGPEEPVLRLTRCPDDGWTLEAALDCPAGEPPVAWLRGDVPFGHAFEVWGPVDAGVEAAGQDAAAVSSRGAETETNGVAHGTQAGAAGARPTQPELGPPSPDPGLWRELDNGRVVRRVLEDFYAQVYADGRLAPFFDGVTMDRAIGKQYAFLQEMLTGEKVYFGERPRNAHHWMVISDELLGHRQALMVATLQQHGLSPAQIARWTRVEAHWRRDLVKSAPWPRKIGSFECPLNGFATEVLTEGSVCDHCGSAVPSGTEVVYHRRLGTISCPVCAPGLPGRE